MKFLRFSLLFVLLLVTLSCEGMFTTSFAGALKRTSVSLPTNLNTKDALALSEEAQASGDTNLINALVPVLTDLSEYASGQDKIDLIVQAAELSIQASGLSQALTDVLTVFASGGTMTPEEQLAAVVSALSNVALSADLVEAMGNLADINPADAGGTNLAFAGIALILESTNGVNIATLSPADLATLQADPDFIAGQALLTSATTQMTAEGVDPSMLAMLNSFITVPTP